MTGSGNSGRGGGRGGCNCPAGSLPHHLQHQQGGRACLWFVTHAAVEKIWNIEGKPSKIQNFVASSIFSIRVTAQLVWWRSLRRTTSWQPPSTSFSSQEWKSKWRTRCFGQRRLVQRCLCLIEFFSGGMFWGSCFNCSANKCGRRGYAVTCCHVHLHGSSLIGACIHFQYFRKPSKHNFKVTKLWTFYGGGGTPIWDCYRQRYARMNPTPLSGVFYLLKMMFWIQPIQRNG